MTTQILTSDSLKPLFTVQKLALSSGSFPKYTIQVRKGDKIVWERVTRNTQQISAHKRDAVNWAAKKYHLDPSAIRWQ